MISFSRQGEFSDKVFCCVLIESLPLVLDHPQGQGDLTFQGGLSRPKQTNKHSSLKRLDSVQGS